MNRQTGLLNRPAGRITSSAAAPSPARPASGNPVAPPARRDGRFALSGSAGLVLLASIVVSFLSASSAPTPLYAIYQAQWGFSPITTTVVFGSYALAVLVALLTLGKVSDHLGRRPVLLAAIGGQAVAMIVFAVASGVSELMVARVVQGLATGAALGALGAGMLDISRERGTLANAVAPGIGTGLGALLSGVVVQYLPAPEHLIYLVLLVVLGVQAAGVLLMQETVSPKPGVLAKMVPDVKLPRATRGPVLVAAPVLIAVWSLAGFYASLGPALIRRLTDSPSVVLGGLGLFLLAGVAASTTFVLRNAAPRSVMFAGVLALLGGTAVTLVAIHTTSPLLFFAGTAVAGVGFGAGFQGGIRTIVPLAAAHERSGVLSLIFVISYIGLGAPAVAAGYLVVHDGGLVHTAAEYGIFVMVLAVLALIGLLRRPGTKSPDRPARSRGNRMLLPGPDHPITVEPANERVTVHVGDTVVADSTSALRLQEASYPAAYYIPMADVDQSLVRRSETTTHCPYKGDAAYYDIVTPEGEISDAIWTYEDPYPAVEAIGSHVAFYPDRVRITAQKN